MILTLLPLWLFTHFLADFILGQNEYIAKAKKRLWFIMMVHAAAYAAAFAVAGASTDWVVLVVLFATHLVIDSSKTRWRIIQQLADRLLTWKQQEVEEYIEASTIDPQERDASETAVQSRVERLEGLAFYFDQAAHLAVVLGLFFTRGQGWLGV